jgi:hypothetical protein
MFEDRPAPGQLDRKRTEAEQARSNSEALQKDIAHYQDTIKLKDEHISFLESTVHQALEKLPKVLPPSEEEAQKKVRCSSGNDEIARGTQLV